MTDDLISRQALIAEIMRRGIYPPGVRHAIENAPTIDAVPVVRCKDCKYITFSDCYGECGRGYLGIVQPNDFCSRGEKRERKTV